MLYLALKTAWEKLLAEETACCVIVSGAPSSQSIETGRCVCVCVWRGIAGLEKRDWRLLEVIKCAENTQREIFMQLNRTRYWLVLKGKTFEDRPQGWVSDRFPWWGQLWDPSFDSDCSSCFELRFVKSSLYIPLQSVSKCSAYVSGRQPIRTLRGTDIIWTLTPQRPP